MKFQVTFSFKKIGVMSTMNETMELRTRYSSSPSGYNGNANGNRNTLNSTAGSIIGVCIFVAIFGAFLYWFCIYRKRRLSQTHAVYSIDGVQPNSDSMHTYGANSGVPLNGYNNGVFQDEPAWVSQVNSQSQYPPVAYPPATYAPSSAYANQYPDNNNFSSQPQNTQAQPSGYPSSPYPPSATNQQQMPAPSASNWNN